MDRAEIRRLAALPGFRALWIGQLISIFGDRFHYLALLALVVQAARDPSNPAPELALIPLVSFLPGILLGPVAGPLVDRWSTKRVLVISDLIRALLVVAMIPAAAKGGVPAAFVVVFLLYVANTFFLPARSAIVPAIVPPETLVAANSLATLAGVLATLVGSLLGGWVIQKVGWKWGFAIDAATYFVSVLALAAIPWTGRRDAPPPRAVPVALYRELADSVAEGLRITARTPRALGAILSMVLLWGAGGVLQVAGTVLLKERTEGVVSGVGSLLAAAGVGMVLGALFLTTRGHRWTGRSIAPLSVLGIGVSLVAFASVRGPAAMHAVAFVAGVFIALVLVATESAIQRSVEEGARGRVFALRDLAARVAVLAAAGIAGLLVGRGALSSAGTVLGAGVVVILAALGGFVAARRVRADG
jgi:MFS family permease